MNKSFNEKVPSLVKNYFYNIIKIVTQTLFPLLTFPYLARVLSPEGIGKVNFADSVCGYLSIIASMGIPLYATRHLAKNRSNKELLSQSTAEILLVGVVTTILAYIILLSGIVFIPLLNINKLLILIYSQSILFAVFNMEWLYQAEEDYKYLSLRQLIIQLISVLLIFCLIKTKNDTNKYAIIVSISNVVSAILNIFISRKYVTFRNLKDLKLRIHLKPMLTIFATSAAVSIYVYFDRVILGLISGPIQVGYYSAAIKVIRLVETVVTSAALVFLPRNSFHYENNNKNKIVYNLKIAFELTLLLSLSSTISIIVLAKQIILVLAGIGYVESILVLKILAPIILFIGISNVITIQANIAIGNEKQTLITVIFGAIINIICNLILIPKYGAFGTAISNLISEFVVLIIAVITSPKEAKDALKSIQYYKYIFVPVIVILVILIIKIFVENALLLIILSCISGIVTFILSNILFREEITMSIIKSSLKLKI